MTTFLFPAGFDATDTRIHHATRAKAAKLADVFAAEYAALSLYVSVDDGVITGWEVRHGADGEDGETVVIAPKVPELGDVLDACIDAGLDPEGEETEEETAPSGSVVKEQYRAAYRAASRNGQTCGDWLAEWLVEQTEDGEGKLDVVTLTAIFNANGLDMTRRWAQLPYTGQKGWQGRYRMNGRQALEQVVALSGKLFDNTGYEIAVPGAFYGALRSKHAKAIAKAERAAKLADDLAKSATEQQEEAA